MMICEQFVLILVFLTSRVEEQTTVLTRHVKPYAEIPGPKELPIIGNSWRFAPIIGNCPDAAC